MWPRVPINFFFILVFFILVFFITEFYLLDIRWICCTIWETDKVFWFNLVHFEIPLVFWSLYIVVIFIFILFAVKFSMFFLTANYNNFFLFYITLLLFSIIFYYFFLFITWVSWIFFHFFQS